MTRHSLCGRCSFNCKSCIIMCSICNFVATTLLPERFRQSHAKPQIAHNESRTNWFHFENHSISVRDRWQGTAASVRCCHVIICFFIKSYFQRFRYPSSICFRLFSTSIWRIWCALAKHRPRMNERTLIMCNDEINRQSIASYRYRWLGRPKYQHDTSDKHERSAISAANDSCGIGAATRPHHNDEWWIEFTRVCSEFSKEKYKSNFHLFHRLACDFFAVSIWRRSAMIF